MAADFEQNKKEKIMEEFAGLLPTLRARLDVTQEELGRRVGATRQTIISIENKKRNLTWSMFLSMAFVFFIDPKTRPFLMAGGIISDELSRTLFGDKSMLAQAKELMDKREK